MMESSETRKLSAILFSDIHGYSRLMQNDEIRTLKLLEEHNRILFPIIESNGGKVVKTIGDAILAVFDSCTNAFRVSVEMQRALISRSEKVKPEEVFRIRIGLHLGETIFKEDDVFGNGVNIAARLQPLADPGGICFSQAVFEQIQGFQDPEIVKVGSVNLKNISEPVIIYRLQIDQGKIQNPLQNIALQTFTESNDSKKQNLDKNGNFIQKIYSILSGVEKTGNWLKSRSVKFIGLFSGTILDFRKIQFIPGETELNILILFGALEVIVPENLNIEMNCNSFLGSTSLASDPATSSPYNLIISGICMFGAVEVKNEKAE